MGNWQKADSFMERAKFVLLYARALVQIGQVPQAIRILIDSGLLHSELNGGQFDLVSLQDVGQNNKINFQFLVDQFNQKNIENSQLQNDFLNEIYFSPYIQDTSEDVNYDNYQFRGNNFEQLEYKIN